MKGRSTRYSSSRPWKKAHTCRDRSRVLPASRMRSWLPFTTFWTASSKRRLRCRARWPVLRVLAPISRSADGVNGDNVGRGEYVAQRTDALRPLAHLKERHDELPRVRHKNGPVSRAGRCRAAAGVRDDPQLGSALYRAAAGGGRVRDAARGHGRTAAAPRGAAALPARESHQGRQGRLHLCRSRRVQVPLRRRIQGVLGISAAAGAASNRRGAGVGGPRGPDGLGDVGAVGAVAVMTAATLGLAAATFLASAVEFVEV